MLRKAYVGLLAVVAVAVALTGCQTAPPNGSAARGALVYDTCVPCHGENGSGNATLRAPAIAGMPEWYVVEQLKKFKGDIRGAHPDDMEGHRMRPMARTLWREGDIEAVAAHVATLSAVPAVHTLTAGDRALGEAAYNGVCVTCHGADGKGNKDLGAPSLIGQPDWYMYAQLQKFHSGMRGAHPDDVYGAQMRAMSMTLADTTAMLDVVAYIKTLPAH